MYGNTKVPGRNGMIDALNTRLSSIFQVKFLRVSVCERSINYNTPKLFNSLPEDILSSPSLKVFKGKLKYNSIYKT